MVNISSITPLAPAGGQTSEKAPSPEALHETAQAFEAVFIAEMLTHAGLDKALAGASGQGGEMFSRMLLDKYAEAMADAGGFGVAEKIYDQLKDNLT